VAHREMPLAHGTRVIRGKRAPARTGAVGGEGRRQECAVRLTDAPRSGRGAVADSGDEPAVGGGTASHAETLSQRRWTAETLRDARRRCSGDLIVTRSMGRVPGSIEDCRLKEA
jgi:hypothetical protein